MQKLQTFTLVPVGGLGNRIKAILSALSFCKEKHRHLEIIWFKDHGLNCDYDKLFHIDAPVNVQIRNARKMDFLLRDNPRRRNFWIPFLFEKWIYDKRIYYYNDFKALSHMQAASDIRLDAFRNIYMVACGIYWENTQMFQWIKPCREINSKVQKITNRFQENTIGLHIRRTDNLHTIHHSPTALFIESIENEIQKDQRVKFYLASDSMEEKKTLLHLYGDRIITSLKETERNNENGIIDAFVEMNVLSRTNKIYAGDSSFARVASQLSGIRMICLGSEFDANYKYK
jgi:hypothetical protein